MSHIETSQFKNRFVSLIIGGQGFPKKHVDRHILFISAALGLEPQRQYSESELNEELRRWTARFGSPVNLDHVSVHKNDRSGGNDRRGKGSAGIEKATVHAQKQRLVAREQDYGPGQRRCFSIPAGRSEE
jgi:hypothetical protein